MNVQHIICLLLLLIVITVATKYESIFNGYDTATDNTAELSRERLPLNFEDLFIEIPADCMVLDITALANEVTSSVDCNGVTNTHSFNVNAQGKTVFFVVNEQAKSVSMIGSKLNNLK